MPIEQNVAVQFYFQLYLLLCCPSFSLKAYMTGNKISSEMEDEREMV